MQRLRRYHHESSRVLFALHSNNANQGNMTTDPKPEELKALAESLERWNRYPPKSDLEQAARHLRAYAEQMVQCEDLKSYAGLLRQTALDLVDALKSISLVEWNAENAEDCCLQMHMIAAEAIARMTEELKDMTEELKELESKLSRLVKEVRDMATALMEGNEDDKAIARGWLQLLADL